MLFFLRRNNQALFTAVLIIAHLATCLLSLWFHQHPGQDHAEVKGGLYHLQASASASNHLESEQEYHALQEVMHLFEGSQLFDGMQASVGTHIGHTFIPGKYVPQIHSFDLPPASFSLSAFVHKTTISLGPVQPAQNYFVLIATGLSPPLA